MQIGKMGANLLGVSLALSTAYGKPSVPTDEKIAKQIIAKSIASYLGPCACL